MIALRRLALLGAVLLVAGCNEKNTAAPPPIRPVLSVVATPTLGRTVSFAATIEPRYSAVLGFRILGRIIARNANVGDVVSKGALLAVLDSVSLELAVRSALAAVANAQAQLVNASANETRQRTLFEQNNTAQAQLDSARMGMETAEAAVTQAQANLNKAQEQLGYAQLRADFDGVVTAVDAEVGQVVSPGQKVVTLARPDVREAVVDVPDELASRLGESARFEIAHESDPSAKATGRIREIAPQADAATRTRRLRLTLDNAPETFRLGAIVRATLESGATPHIELPASAIVDSDGKTSVWIVDPAASTVSLHPITIAAASGGSVEVTGGLTQGSRVVTAGVHSLAPGQSVRILDGDGR
jgi:membrane fusion protein, multidrug efflux system